MLTTPCPTEQAIHRKLYTDDYVVPPIDWHLFELVKAALPVTMKRFHTREHAALEAISVAKEVLSQLRGDTF